METDDQSVRVEALKEQYRNWKHLPETQMFFKYLNSLRESAKDDWAYEQFVGNDLNEWALRNAKALGGVQVIKNLIDMEFIDE